MGIFHFIQGILMVVLSNDFSLPVNTNYVEFDAVSQQLVPVMEKLTSLRFGPLVAAFLFMSAAAHLLLTLPGVYEWYIKNLKRGINYARWWEYAFSSSVMIVLIGMLTGVYDLGALIMMFSLNAVMIFFGLVMEIHNQTTKKVNWTSYIFGCVAGIVPWIIVALNLYNAGEGENKAPTFVYYIFFSIFLFFNTFAVNMVLQYKKVGKWKDYVWGEKVYILLSLLAKSALAWQVFAGTLRPE
jgi:hypothetical protein